MIRLSDYIASILSELEVSLPSFVRARDNTGQSYELELNLPLVLRFGEPTTENDQEGNLTFVYECALLTLQSAKVELGISKVRHFLLNEIELLFRRLTNPKLNKPRVLRDFCQRVLVNFQERIEPGPAAQTGTGTGEKQGQDLFDGLTDDLFHRLESFLSGPGKKTSPEGVWAILNTGEIVPKSPDIAGRLVVRVVGKEASSPGPVAEH